MSSDALQRIEACRTRIAQHEQAIRDEHKLRNQLIRQARDLGHTFGELAKSAGRSKARCATIVGESDE